MSDTPHRVRIDRCRISWEHLFKPWNGDDPDENKLQYSCCIMIPKKDKKTLAKLEAALEVAKQTGKSKKWQGKIPAKLKYPIKDGDEDEPEREEFAGMMFFTARNTKQPDLWYKEKRDGSLVRITDETELFSGCYCAIVVEAFPYNTNSNGVSFSLKGVMLLDNDPELSLAGFSSTVEDFEDMAEDEDDDI